MDSNPDVLVIGLGPVGAAFAALCAQSGLSVCVVERDTAVYRLPRAVAMDHEVLRQVGMIGVADAVVAASRPSYGYEFVNKDDEILVARYQSELAPTGYHFANMFHQPSFEAAMRARLAELPGVSVNLGWEVTAIQQNRRGVTATVETPDGPRTLTARYAVGCDGGRSIVRRTLGAGMIDLGFDEPWLVVDVTLADGVEVISDKGRQLCDPERPTTSTQSGPGRHRWEFMLRPDESAEEVTRPESIRQRISRWVDPDTVTIERSAVYQFHGLVAESWRDGNIIIIGDAAHQMPPFLGQGLCSGVRDAFNLAWKLVAVLRDEADESLLDTVQTERSPHVMAITEAAIALGKIVCITDPVAASERDRQFRADRDAGKPPPFPKMPNIDHGVLDDDVGGRVLPEGFAQALEPTDETLTRIDEIAGYKPLFIVADAEALSQQDRDAIDGLRASTSDMVFCCLTGAGADFISLLDTNGHIRAMLNGATALLAKPDRIVFGRGSAAALATAWADYLGGHPFLNENCARRQQKA
ncbi:MAG: bifunctional 3-(3-hydroxy-phenyl)propionate/3-hydroxycinnamic acid hydroxylase [Pseudomonadota bacterium]